MIESRQIREKEVEKTVEGGTLQFETGSLSTDSISLFFLNLPKNLTESHVIDDWRVGPKVSSLSVRVPSLSEKLKKMAELNFCENCYRKYLVLIHGEIEYLLSEPISDWKQVEANINKLMMKAKGYCKNDSTVIFPDIESYNEEMKREKWGFKRKINFLKKEGIIKEALHNFLRRVNEIRNRIHKERTQFSTRDYDLFREADALTSAMVTPILFDLKDDRWKRYLADVENRARWLLSKLNSCK